MTKKCYMMVGVPGCGKSTATDELIKKNPQLEIISTDIFIEQYAKKEDKTYQQVYREIQDGAQKWMNQQIKEVMNKDKDFIWDQTNVYLTSRTKKMSKLRQNHYEIIAIVVELTEQELKRRIDKRAKETGKKISYKIMQDMLTNYVRPDYSEGFSEIYIIGDDGEAKLAPKPENIIYSFKQKNKA